MTESLKSCNENITEEEVIKVSNWYFKNQKNINHCCSNHRIYLWGTAILIDILKNESENHSLRTRLRERLIKIELDWKKYYTRPSVILLPITGKFP